MSTGERFVLVTVKIATSGQRCADACEFFNEEFLACDLFRDDLERDPAAPRMHRRHVSCLALDEPNAPGVAESSGPDAAPLPHRRRRGGAPPCLPSARVRDDARGRRGQNR